MSTFILLIWFGTSGSFAPGVFSTREACAEAGRQILTQAGVSFKCIEIKEQK